MSPSPINQSTETTLKMMQVRGGAVGKAVEVAIISVLKCVKENVLIVSEKMGQLSIKKIGFFLKNEGNSRKASYNS